MKQIFDWKSTSSIRRYLKSGDLERVGSLGQWMLSGSVSYNVEVNFDKRLSAYFADLGRKSVKARMKTLSPKRREQIAKNAAKARWAKKKRKKK